ncbi:MAG TPA: thermonuclease family protein [Xanthobacteraceae bacterium]|nr:thermonuclease family protein [Xanthobacteraceae bacterium]
MARALGWGALGWGALGWGAALALAVAAGGGFTGVFAQDNSVATAPACGGDPIADTTVSQINDGRTVTLADGREVRLAAIEVPLPMAESGGATAAVAAGNAAEAALDALAGGDHVVLRRAESGPDRYGRLVAYAYTERDGDQLFVQGELITAGYARVGDRVAGRACATELLARESAARRAKLGLWADPYYDLIEAETPAAVLAHRGQFVLVEGTVVSVRESGPTIYVNFGQRWSEDFSVTVRKRNERSFADAGLDLKGLEGRRVIVRGFVEARGTRNMPSIEAARPEQIETADRN